MAISPLLGIGLATAGLPGAIAKGQKAGTDQFNAEEDRKAKRADAELRRQQGELQLQQLQGQVNRQGTLDNSADLQLQQTQMKLQQLQAKTVKADTYTALNNFFDSGDPRSLNQFFQDYKDDPQVQSMFKGVIKVDPVNPNNSEDQQLLIDAGLSQEELDAADGTKDGNVDWAKLNKRFVKVVNRDGETKITDMLHVAAATGYSRYASNQQLERMKALADIAKAQKTSAAPRDPNDTKTSLVKNSEAVAAAQERITAGTGTEQDRQLIAGWRNQIAGSDAGKETLASNARQTWDDAGFDNMSPEQLRKNKTARDIVNEIELAHPLSQAHQKELLDLNAMIALSSEAGKLSDDQTGLFDKLTNNVTSYTSDDVGGKKNKAAYGAFINQFRHNLFGSALTDGELAAFKEAYGGLGQKAGPVLAGLRAALIQVKSKMQTISNLNDPRVIKFRTGKSAEDVAAALKGVDERLAFYDAVASGLTPDEAKAKAKGAPSDLDSVTAALFGE